MAELAENVKEQPFPRVKVKLKKPHTHAGKRYDEEAVKEGVTIEVTEAQSKRLAGLGVI